MVGPFKVLKKVGRLAYRLDFPSHWQIHPVVSVAHLELVPKGSDPINRPLQEQPPAVVVTSEKELVVNKIVSHHTVRRGKNVRKQYQLR